MISVCMATYNGEQYLKAQIDSILCQLGEDDELVISDDHSVDHTKEIILRYDDPRIRYYDNALVKGVTHNFENALMKAKGDIIFLADQDDVWYPEKIMEMTDFMMQGNYDVVTCNCALTDAELNIKRDAYYTTESPLDRSVWGNFKKDLWLGCCMAFRRDILDDVLPIPPQLAAHDMWISLYGQLHYHCGYYPKVLQLYRRHPETVNRHHGPFATFPAECHRTVRRPFWLLRGSFFYFLTPDPGADVLQFKVKVFVTSVNVIDVINGCNAFCQQTGNNQTGSAA